MNIDTNTVNVLKNFAKINPSIVIMEGNTLKTISTSKTIMAKAKVPTDFPQRFAIYNLDRFISTLSLYTKPDLKFKEKYVEVTEDNRRTTYTYADESTITKLPEKEIVIPSVDVKFTLTNTALKEVEKALGVLSLPEIMVVGDGSSIYLQASDSKNPSGDTYSLKVADNTTGIFKAIFKAENIKIIPGDYEVSISSRGISHFRSGDIEYWIAVEKHSEF
jgi:hypothetical protein